MGRPRRTSTCLLHHITGRGNNRGALYADGDDRERFYDILARALAPVDVECHHDVQMGNHYHLLLGGPIEAVSEVMWRLNYRHALTYNRRYGRTDHLLGKRFFSSPVPGAVEFRTVALYIVRNPVRAKLCREPTEWPHGSCRAHLGLEPPLPHLCTALTAEHFPAAAGGFAAACARSVPARPLLAELLPARERLTPDHLRCAIGVFGYDHDAIAQYYRVSPRTIRRWVAG